ncbi:hypothetical protein ON010_g52 [Phytophthora cinnamomi]|nr:hypothetical protein ON010_g52 [Phytophthora cinnamomi]
MRREEEVLESTTERGHEQQSSDDQELGDTPLGSAYSALVVPAARVVERVRVYGIMVLWQADQAYDGPADRHVTRCLHDDSEQPTATSIDTNMARNKDAVPAKKTEGDSSSDALHTSPSRLSNQDATLRVASNPRGGSNSALLVRREQHEQRTHHNTVKIYQKVQEQAQ